MLLADSKDGTILCGGTLIGEYYVLTAGHCVNDVRPENVLLFFGKNKRNSYDEGEVKRTVSKIILHPFYKWDPIFVPAPQNDIAILKLEKSVKMTKDIQPACIAAHPGPREGEKVKISGWGRTSPGPRSVSSNVLKAAELEILSWEKCDERVYKTEYTEFTKNMICATSDGKGGCHGDSGGL